MDCDCVSCLIVFSLEFHGYKRLQHLIPIIFKNHDLRISFLDFSHDTLS